MKFLNSIPRKSIYSYGIKKRNNNFDSLKAYNKMLVCSVNNIITWKQYLSVIKQHVRPVHLLRIPAGMRVSMLTPSGRLLKHGL